MTTEKALKARDVYSSLVCDVKNLYKEIKDLSKAAQIRIYKTEFTLPGDIIDKFDIYDNYSGKIRIIDLNGIILIQIEEFEKRMDNVCKHI